MLRRSNYDLVDEDGYDMRIPAVSEEAFQYGIVFKLKVITKFFFYFPCLKISHWFIFFK